MKIEKVEAFIMHLPVTGDSIADSTHRISLWGVVGAKIRTSSGLEGIGFTGTHAHMKSDQAIARFISEVYEPLLIGENPLEHQRLWEKLFHFPPIQWIGRSGISQLALSAIDVALWDVKAKEAGLPLWALLGGSHTERMRAYNTDVGWLSLSNSELVDSCRRCCEEEGFTAVKLKVGSDNILLDVGRVEAVRRALGSEILISVDANGKFDLPRAARLSGLLEPYDVLWFEEPMWFDDVEGHALLAKSTKIPIALGEQIYSVVSLGQFIARRAVQFVQPDVTRIGGITSFLEVAKISSTNSLPVAPHAGEMSQVHIHLAFHLSSCSILEYIPWIRHCFAEPATVKDGYFLRPQMPGVGTTFTEETVRKYGEWSK
jgi:L-alanine-DL-glutamate epimerase-like enolase superfamily enzyme